MAKLHECSSCERTREADEMDHGVCKPCRTIADQKQEIGRLRTMFRVNMLRLAPTLSHDEITAALDHK